jgi:hypothetical protein
MRILRDEMKANRDDNHEETLSAIDELAARRAAGAS